MPPDERSADWGRPSARLIIVGELFGFPRGMAATARVWSYARGLRTHGVATALILRLAD